MSFGNARTRIDHGQCSKGEQQSEGGAVHSWSPNCLSRPIDHAPGGFIPEQFGSCRAAAQGWLTLAVVVN
jgi:hypothetical protein